MSRKGIWPAKAVNLLVALAMVISMVAVLAPVTAIIVAPGVAAAQGQTAPSLMVDVTSWLKDPCNGNITPLVCGAIERGGVLDRGDVFYINAAVANNGNGSAEGVTATIDIDGNAILATGETYTKTIGVIEGCALDDAWWKLQCSGPGNVTITVTAVGTNVAEAEDYTDVCQYVPEPICLLTVTEVEKPDGMVEPCQNFGIKALITNCNSCITAANVVGIITISGPASIVGGDPNSWPVGNIAPGDTQEVGWTLHCDGPGNVSITVSATSTTQIGTITNWGPFTVHQKVPATLVVTITEPLTCTDILSGCPGNTTPCTSRFVVNGYVTNVGDVDALAVTATLSWSPGGNVDWQTTTPPQVPVKNLGDILAGHTVAWGTWSVYCKAPGNTSIIVSASGYDKETSGQITDSDTQIVRQKTYYVDLVGINCLGNHTGSLCDPGEMTVSTKGNFTICAIFHNGGPALTGATGTLTIDNPALAHIVSPGATQTFNICLCCKAEKCWTLQCDLPGDVVITVTWRDAQGVFLSSETFIVHQELKAHLTVGMGTFIQDANGIMQPRAAFVPGQIFHLIVPVFNVGEATATNVIVRVQLMNGNVTLLSGPAFGANATIGEIPGGTVYKLIYKVQCTGEGPVNFQIDDPSTVDVKENVWGNDTNTCASILFDNICIECPLVVKQIPLEVNFIEPNGNATHVSVCDDFTVKGNISNWSTLGDDILGMTATLIIRGHASLVQPQTATKALGTLKGNRTHEITWQVHCDGPGDVGFFIQVDGATPRISLTTDLDTQECGLQPLVVVQDPVTTTLCVEILSPEDETEIATSQKFAVTALVRNCGANTALDVSTTIYTEYEENVGTGSDCQTAWDLDNSCVIPADLQVYLDGVLTDDYTFDTNGYNGMSRITFDMPPGTGVAITATYLANFSLDASEPGNTMARELGNISANGTATETWTLHGFSSCSEGCDYGDFDIYVMAEATNLADGNGNDSVGIHLYPAAHLTAEIMDIEPASPINVCDTFVVTYRVYNTGQADAWEVSATLDINPPGSVRIADGEGGYSQYLGTIEGWSDFGDSQYKESTFTLHCKMACESTLTIIPSGRDECGWIDYDLDDYTIYMESSAEPGARISPAMIDIASETVKQLESGALDLGITKTVDDASPAEEQDINFTITVTNYGPTDASGIEVTDLLPAELIYVDDTASQGAYDADTGIWAVGSLVDGTSATLVITATVDTADPIENCAEITAVDQPDPYGDNDIACLTLNLTTWCIELNTGWNLISLPLLPGNTSIDAVLGAAKPNVDSIYAYDPTWPSPGWKSWINAGPKSLTTMDDTRGYWVLMTYTDTICITGAFLPVGKNVPPTFAVAAGWNLIGFKSLSERTAGGYLLSLGSTWTRLWGFENGSYHGVLSGNNMEPGFGYWLSVSSAGTIYP